MIKFIAKTTDPNITNFITCTIGGTEQELIQSIASCGKCIVEVSKHTKTSINLSLQSPEEHKPTFNISLPRLVPDMKFIEKKITSFWDFTPTYRYYFKLSKKQGMPQLKEYIQKVLELKGLDKLSIDIDCEVFFIGEARSLYIDWLEMEANETSNAA